MVLELAYDGLFMNVVTNELKEKLLTGRITRIYQPFKTDLLITVRANGKNYSLLLSAHPSYARMHLTKEKYDNPEKPSMFCMLLRKHLEGAIIDKITQNELERVAIFSIKGKDELGDDVEKQLIIEIMARHSNIILVNGKSKKIIDSLKHVTLSQSSVRTILPGQTYTFPPAQNKVHPLKIDENTFLSLLDFNQGKMDKQLVDTFSGLSPLIAKEIIHRAQLVNQTSLTKAFFSVMKHYKKKKFEPQMILTEKKDYFSLIPLTHLKGERKTFTDVHELLDRFYFQKANRDQIKQMAHDIERFLQNERQKNEKKIEKLKETLNEAEQAEIYQKYGELLTAHLHLIKKGKTEAQVVDYYDENASTITIPLDPKKSPAENAQSFFKKYHKLKNSVEIVKEQIENAKEEIAYFEQLLTLLENASPNDVAEMREELIEEGYLKKQIQETKKKKKDEKRALEKYVSSAGIDIYVGKNNKQNEYLTHRFARPNDIWLHAKEIPGSHVVIKSENPDKKTLKEAAMLAAYFSKAKHSSNVPVDYTKIRYVKKPSGAKPGFVIYRNETTLYVTPEEDLVRKLRAHE